MTATPDAKMWIGQNVLFLLTILFTAIGWGIVHTLDQALNAPTVEYCSVNDEIGRAKVVIENLSRKTAFRNLTFGFRRSKSSDAVFSNSHLYADRPHFVGITQGGKIKPGGTSVEFTIPILHPNARVTMEAQFTDTPNFDFLIVGVGTNDNPRDITSINLLECGPFSWFLKHEMEFIILFVVIFFVFATTLIIRARI